MKRGEIYLASVRPRSGAEITGNRPVLVVSHDSFNRVPNWRSIIIVPISTSQAQQNRGPTAVLLPKDSGGLARDSVAVCHQITTLDRSKLNRRIGELEESLMEEVGKGIKAAVDLS